MAKRPLNPVAITGGGVVSPVQSRNVPPATRLFLYVRAGGRCEFDGCNEYLLEHHVTKTPGNFAEMAHIFAFSDGGPRGDKDKEKDEIHGLDNLVLLCPKCHKLIDTNPDVYPVEVVKSFKKAHEDRIFELTDTKPDRGTVAVVLRGRIADRPVTVELAEVQKAVKPRYVGARSMHDIDLTVLCDSTKQDFWWTCAKAIRKKMQSFYETSFDNKTPHHVSVFGLAPIPLLMVLGNCLSDKVPTSLFQRHRDTESWEWKNDGPIVEFEVKTHAGNDPTRVAVVISVSGVIAESDLPKHIDSSYSVYWLAPKGVSPDRPILHREESLQEFRSTYQKLMRQIVEEHPDAKAIDIFPAVPAPAAVAMGRDLLPKRDPVLVVYDFHKANGGFAKTLEINDS